MGIAKALRETNPKLHVAAVEPAESPVMSGGVAGPHSIGGIGDGFVPEIVRDERGDLSPLINEIISVRSSDATEASMYIAKNFGYCVGISSGANFLAARELSRRFGTVVTVLPDGFTRYISLGLGSSGSCQYHGDACRATPAYVQRSANAQHQ